jgi:hypothetical protein
VDDAGRFQLPRRGRDASEHTYVSFAVPPFGERLHSLEIWQFGADRAESLWRSADVQVAREPSFLESAEKPQT